MFATKNNIAFYVVTVCIKKTILLFAQLSFNQKMSLESTERSPLLLNKNKTDISESEVIWNKSHILKIIIGAGAGTFLEFYAFALVAYFETEIINAYFPSTSSKYNELLEAFALFGVGMYILTFSIVIQHVFNN